MDVAAEIRCPASTTPGLQLPATARERWQTVGASAPVDALQLMFTTPVVVPVIPSALNEAFTPAAPGPHGPGTWKTT